MSFSLHSSTENLGGGRRSASVGSNSSSRLSWPVKSSIGLMSSNASARPLSKNHWNESRWMAIKSGRGSASSMLAKDTRSGLRDRGDNGHPPRGFRGGCRAGRRNGEAGQNRGPVLRAGAEGDRTKTPGQDPGCVGARAIQDGGAAVAGRERTATV